MSEVKTFNQTLLSNLGIELYPSMQDVLSGQNLQDIEIMATMPVDERTIQPFGFLSGGASLALAETLAGYASRLHCKDGFYPLGMQVSANHLASIAYDLSNKQKVVARAKAVHIGNSTHVWDVNIQDEQGKNISAARITNIILPIRK